MVMKRKCISSSSKNISNKVVAVPCNIMQQKSDHLTKLMKHITGSFSNSTVLFLGDLTILQINTGLINKTVGLPICDIPVV